MRRQAFTLLLGLLLASVASPVLADDPYSEFRIPDFQTFRATVSGSFRFDDGLSSTFSERTSRSSQPNLTAIAEWRAESDARLWSASLAPRASWFSSRVVDRFDASAFLSERTDRLYSDAQELRATLRHDRYLSSSELFVGGAAELQPSFSRLHSTEVNRSESLAPSSINEQSFDEHLGSHRFLGTLTFRAGWGHLRDASGVYVIRVLEQRLRATGRLTRELSRDTRRKLVELWYAGGGFSAAHERPTRYFWREVERLLREDGALEGGTLDAWSTFRLLEPLNRRGVTRNRGTRLAAVTGLFAQRGHLDRDRSSDYVVRTGGVVVFESHDHTSARERLFQNDELTGAQFELGRPLGDDWQVNVASTVRYGGGARRVWLAESQAEAVWLLGERWYAATGLQHAREDHRRDGHRIEPNWAMTSLLSAGYWIEDAWTLDAFVTSDQSQIRALLPFSLLAANRSLLRGSGYSRNTSVFLALTYRPGGSFRMPGLGISESVLRGAL